MVMKPGPSVGTVDSDWATALASSRKAGPRIAASIFNMYIAECWYLQKPGFEIKRLRLQIPKG